MENIIELPTLELLPKRIEEYPDGLNKVMNYIKFQVELCQYDLDGIYSVVDNLDRELPDAKNNGLYVKFQYLYDIVGAMEFFVYLKVILLDMGFDLEKILIAEISSYLPDEENDLLDIEVRDTLHYTLDLISNESGLSKIEIKNICKKAGKIKYGYN